MAVRGKVIIFIESLLCAKGTSSIIQQDSPSRLGSGLSSPHCTDEDVKAACQMT